MNLQTAVALAALMVAQAGIAHSQTPQVSKTDEPSYLQALTAAERKDYEALKADWEKQRKADPTAFKKMQAKMTLQSQMILGRFGYGTLFTGALDDRTRDALRAYQTKKGVPASGEVDPITYYWLTRDDDTADRRITSLPAFSFGYYDDYVSASGAWDRFNTSNSHYQGAYVECHKDQGVCFDVEAVEMEILGMWGITAQLTQYQITKWDQYEVVAEDTTPECERDQLLINRQEKSVTLLSTPTYKSESCKKLLGKPETVTYRLVGGTELLKARMEADRKEKSGLYQLSEGARTILSSK